MQNDLLHAVVKVAKACDAASGVQRDHKIDVTRNVTDDVELSKMAHLGVEHAVHERSQIQVRDVHHGTTQHAHDIKPCTCTCKMIILWVSSCG